MIKETNVYTVSQVNLFIKETLSHDRRLKHVSVKGELSNFKVYPSGHIYFSIKDNDSIISAVMFANYAKALTFIPKNGDEVVVNASLDVYVPSGKYQLMVYEMEELGQGALLLELEKLKKKLASEGLFDESRKRNINIYPKAIGVITAPNGAAVRDIVTNIKRRYPIADIYVFPSSVQGENAPKELIHAFNLSQTYDLDTLIIGRGGGASEDLSAFNDEALVRAIATSKFPVIAAVGHEIDITLVDYVADKRASTPTGAAELATVDIREIIQFIDYANETLTNSLLRVTDDYLEELNDLKEDMDRIIKDKLEKYSTNISSLKEHLNALCPTKILKRGYSISTDHAGKVITKVKQVKKGDKIKTILEDGSFTSVVED